MHSPMSAYAIIRSHHQNHHGELLDRKVAEQICQYAQAFVGIVFVGVPTLMSCSVPQMLLTDIKSFITHLLTYLATHNICEEHKQLV